MPRVCQFCGKHTASGTKLSHRGRAKHLGGVGIKTTGVTKRKFRPNLQSVRALINGSVKTVRICTRCLKSGKITKPPVA